MSKYVVIITIVIVGLTGSGTAVALNGSGTQQDPWLIQSLEDFNDFAADANYWAGFTRLETDVNLAGMVYERAVIAPDVNSAEGGFQGIAFAGVFNGNDHKVLNLTIDDAGANNDYLGLFGCIDGGEVMNLGIEGGFVSGEYDVGGLVGGNFGIVSNCYCTGDMSGYSSVGGLVGMNGFVVYFPTSAKAGYIYNSYSTGSVQGDSFVGGLVGLVINGDVSNCCSISDVNGNEAGGLVGVNYGIVSNCYAAGDVNGVSTVGGLVGRNGVHTGGYPGTDPGYIHYSYSTGAVQGNSHVGGLVGHNFYGTVSNCYSKGDVNGVEDVGGLVGANWDDVWNCFWDIETSAEPNMCGNENPTCDNSYGKTTDEMQTRSTFTDTGWDFINVWGIGENQTYPYLRTFLAGDINKDGIVNFLDLSITANQWMEEQ